MPSNYLHFVRSNVVMHVNREFTTAGITAILSSSRDFRRLACVRMALQGDQAIIYPSPETFLTPQYTLRHWRCDRVLTRNHDIVYAILSYRRLLQKPKLLWYSVYKETFVLNTRRHPAP